MAINQYKEGKGINDHKKGNRTNSKRNAVKITEYNKQYKEDIDAYKEYARRRREARTVKQDNAGDYYKRLTTYISECMDNDKPVTRAGIILQLGVNKDTYYQMKSGDLDYRLDEYIHINNIKDSDIYINSDGLPATMNNNMEILLIPFSELIEKTDLILEQAAEERLYSKSRVGDIFTLKSLHGWQDDNTPHTVNQTLVLASPEQAREAIRLLK